VRWLNNGWRNAKKEPVANADLWEPLIEMYVSLADNERPDFQWVKGHNGDPMNERVDQLAVAAIPS
jgi:ribonuclease HI